MFYLLLKLKSYNQIPYTLLKFDYLQLISDEELLFLILYLVILINFSQIKQIIYILGN